MRLLLNLFTLLTAFSLVVPAAAQNGTDVTVNGVVTSAEDGLPMVGVAVMAGPTDGVITMDDGSYSISVKPGTELTFSSVGYKTLILIVPAGGGRLDAVMESDNLFLDDVVVIAYGVRKKGTVAGSVSSLKADKIEDAPTAAFDQALQGQVPGLSVMSTSGEPSSSTFMTIRGTNSINSGVAPLYILDGTAISASDFNTINPSDIESISVLKDASSTSIYGARAANGVIVITTKRGKMAEKAVINYRMQLGFSDLAYGNWDMMNTAERIQYEKEVGLIAGKDYSVLSQTDVNWLDEIYSKSALLQSYELSVSGANEKTNYYFSGGYYDQDGLVEGSDFQRYSLRSNIEQKASSWLKVGMNTMLNYQNIMQAVQGQPSLLTPISAAMFMLPYWNPYNEDGSLASVNDGTWKGEGQNPIEWNRNNPVTFKKYKLLTTLFAEANPIKGLTIRSQFNVDYAHTTGFGKSYPEYAPNLGEGQVTRSSTDALTLSVTIRSTTTST